MNDNTTEQSAPPPEPQAAPPPPPRTFRQAASDGFRAAREDAERAAKAAIPKAQELFSQTAYDLSYISGFGTYFGLTLIKEILPESMKAGFAAGARKGTQTAEDVTEAAKAPPAGPQPAAATEVARIFMIPGRG